MNDVTRGDGIAGQSHWTHWPITWALATLLLAACTEDAGGGEANNDGSDTDVEADPMYADGGSDDADASRSDRFA